MADGRVDGRHVRRVPLVLVLVLSLVGPIIGLPAPPAAAEPFSISGTVVDAVGAFESDVAVEVVGAGITTMTGVEGTFMVTVPSSGPYDLKFTPPPSSGLRPYTASGIDAASGVPLTIVLKPITIVRIEGTLRDSTGKVYTSADEARAVFSSPLNPFVAAGFDANGRFAVDVLADDNFSVSIGTSSLIASTTGRTFEQNETIDITIPLSTLAVSVRHSDGSPVIGATVNLGSAFANPMPGMPGWRAAALGNAPVDDSGNASFIVPTGSTISGASVRLSSGIVVPFDVPVMNGDRRLFVIFDPVTGVVIVDGTPPVVTPIPDRPSTNGWYNAPVTIGWMSADPSPSSGAPTVPTSVTVSSEGIDQIITSETSCDPAGNCASGQASVSIDLTAPTIEAELQPVANENGWNNGDVNVTFDCNDALSGVATCPAPIVVSADGVSQLVTGTVVDHAGNSTTITRTINLDKTGPTIDVEVSQSPNVDGWNNGDVTIEFTCEDELSGIAMCSGPVTLTEDGPNQLVVGTAVDKAGNTSTAAVSVSIDKTKPFISATRTEANANGWNNGDVLVTFTCCDAMSVIVGCPLPVTLSQEGANQSVTGTVTDAAGNSATATVDSINVDKTPPEITATVLGTKSPSGWYTTTPVVHFTCADALSGIETCPPDIELTDGANQSFVRTATDRAGNTSEVTVTDVDVDGTAPVVEINGPIDGSTYLLGQVPAATCSTVDATSGVSVAASLETTSYAAAGVVNVMVTCSGATDIAGNTRPPVSISYMVTPDAASLTALTAQYILETGAANANGAIHDLGNKLSQGKVCEFIDKVNERTPTSITPTQAATLIFWARVLDPSC